MSKNTTFQKTLAAGFHSFLTLVAEALLEAPATFPGVGASLLEQDSSDSDLLQAVTDTYESLLEAYPENLPALYLRGLVDIVDVFYTGPGRGGRRLGDVSPKDTDQDSLPFRLRQERALVSIVEESFPGTGLVPLLPFLPATVAAAQQALRNA